jgi:lysyl-tRNA synthetase, class II
VTVEVARAVAPGERPWIPRVVGAVCLAIGILDVAAAVTPRLWLHFRLLADYLPGALSQATVAALLVVGVGFMLLAGGLARRKRRAWQLSVVLLAASVVLHLSSDTPHVGLATVSLGMLVALVAYQREFYAAGDPYTRWTALRYLVVLLPLSLLIGVLLAYGFRSRFAHRVGPWQVLKYVAAGLVGLPSPLDQQPGVRPGIVYYALLALGLVTFGTVAFLLLRSPRPLPVLSPQDQVRMRDLLAKAGERDSLGYFALRRDKSVIWSQSAKACVAYRVTAGVMLASGDPIGDPEAWPGAIAAFVEEAKRHAWIPAVAACSETGAAVWCREAGLDALGFGDEAIVEVDEFSLDGRSMRNVRQMVNRVCRAGYQVEVRRLRDIPPDELAELRRLASEWRVGDIERGYSMALGRFGDPDDADCVVATARQGGAVRALLSFVPWGTSGLSLDVMRRDHAADPGANELMIVETLHRAGVLGVERVSLNFAVFRDDLARGERIGAGPGTRAWRRVLLVASRWAQIESLYRFNAKFGPVWEPRFILYPDVGDLPRVAVAYLEAEAFIRYPRLAFWRSTGRSGSTRKAAGAPA